MAAAIFVCAPSAAQAQSPSSPTRLTLGFQGRILVSDYKEKAILTLDPRTLQVMDILPLPGRPLGIAWDRNRVFVGNETSGSVTVYNSHGKELYDLGEGAVRLRPNDLAVDGDRRLVFVADGLERNVKVFGAGGSFLYSIPGPDATVGLLTNPTGVAVDPENREVIVSDFGDPLVGVPAGVRIYDYQGHPRAVISGESDQPGFGFSRPQGLAVDGAGRIFLTDSLLGQVLVFDRLTLQGVATLGEYGSGPGQLLLPLDVIFEPDSGNILVANNRLGRIEVFPRGGLVP